MRFRGQTPVLPTHVLAQALAGLSADPPLVRLPGAAPDQSRLLPGLVLREGPFGSGAVPAMAALARCDGV